MGAHIASELLTVLKRPIHLPTDLHFCLSFWGKKQQHNRSWFHETTCFDWGKVLPFFNLFFNFHQRYNRWLFWRLFFFGYVSLNPFLPNWAKLFNFWCFWSRIFSSFLFSFNKKKEKGNVFDDEHSQRSTLVQKTWELLHSFHLNKKTDYFRTTASKFVNTPITYGKKTL